jgi:hypothetical protein
LPGNTEIPGAVASVTTTLNDVDASGEIPFAAVAVTVVAPSGNGSANDRENDTDGTGAPVVDTIGSSTVAEHVDDPVTTAMSATGAIVGGAPVIRTVKLRSVQFPDSSVERNVTNVSPNGNVDPETGPAVCVTVGGTMQLSLENGFPKIRTRPAPLVACNSMSDIGNINGACRSLTTTSKVSIASGLTPFAAVTITAVDPFANVPGHTGDTVTVGTGTPDATTDGCDTAAEHTPGSVSTKMSPIGSIVGAAPTTVTVNDAVAGLPFTSVAS